MLCFSPSFFKVDPSVVVGELPQGDFQIFAIEAIAKDKAYLSARMPERI
ncbi:hypothetical protein B224_6025 [Aeromonas media WS]|nr:hypothetical protein B224_6025 [Aeromonas media WS]